MLLRSILTLTCAVTFAGAIRAENPPAKEPCVELTCVVAKRGTAIVTVADVAAKIKTLDGTMQSALLSDPKQLNKMLENLLILRQLANELAPNDPQTEILMQARLKQVQDEVVAVYRLNQVRAERVTGNFEQLARENYLTNLAAMRTPRQLSVRHLLIAIDGRGEAAAQARAKELEVQLAGADLQRFQELAMTHSDDPNKANDTGLLKFNEGTKDLDLEFLEGSLALSKVGEISPPIRSDFGYHFIQLVADTPARVIPFDEAKSTLIQKLKKDAETRVTVEYRTEVSMSGELEFYPQNLEKLILGELIPVAN